MRISGRKHRRALFRKHIDVRFGIKAPTHKLGIELSGLRIHAPLEAIGELRDEAGDVIREPRLNAGGHLRFRCAVTSPAKRTFVARSTTVKLIILHAGRFHQTNAGISQSSRVEVDVLQECHHFSLINNRRYRRPAENFLLAETNKVAVDCYASLTTRVVASAGPGGTDQHVFFALLTKCVCKCGIARSWFGSERQVRSTEFAATPHVGSPSAAGHRATRATSNSGIASGLL